MGRNKRYACPVVVREALPALAVLALCALLAACSAAPPGAGHAKRALDPAGFPQAAAGQGWEAALVRTTEGPAGVDYSTTTLLPVLLVFKNTGPGQPQVILEDVRGLGEAAEFLAYTPEEAMPLAATRTLSRKAANTAKGAAVGAGVGAALGAGAGVAVTLLTGRQDLGYAWVGAAGGGAAGALAGAALSESGFSKAELEAIRADLAANAWNEDPITPGTTRSGYLLLPAGQGIKSVRLLVRTDEAAQAVTLPIASGGDYAAPGGPGRPARAAMAPEPPRLSTPPAQAAPVQGGSPAGREEQAPETIDI